MIRRLRRNAGRDPDKKDALNRQGVGLGADGDPSPTVSTAFVPGVAAYALQPRIGCSGRGDMADVVSALTMSGEMGKGDTAAVRDLLPELTEGIEHWIAKGMLETMNRFTGRPKNDNGE